MPQSPVYVEIARLRKENEVLRAQLSESKKTILNNMVVENNGSSNRLPQSSGETKYIQEVSAFQVTEVRAKLPLNMHVKHDKDINRTSGTIPPAGVNGESDDIEQHNTLQSSDKADSCIIRRGPGVDAYYVVVNTGLVGNLPASIQFGTKHKPCAVFSVQNSHTKENCWSFIKSDGQLRVLDNVLKKALGPLIRRGEFRICSLPPKDLYLSCVPWKVDVRNDMLNAYFLSIFNLQSINSYNTRIDIRSKVEQALATFWLRDIVDYIVPIKSHTNGGIISPMSGCLLTRIDSKSWSCKYCFIQNGYLNVVGDTRGKATCQQIPLDKAYIKSVVVLFDATDNDARYLFEIHEPTGKVHRFTAESQGSRRTWIKWLMFQIASIKRKEIDASSASSTAFAERLPPFTISGLPNSRGIGHMEGSTSYLSRHSSSTSTLSDSSAKDSGYSLYDELNNDEDGSEGKGTFDGEEFYMQISKTENNQELTFNGEKYTTQNSNSSGTSTIKSYGSTLLNITISEPRSTPFLTDGSKWNNGIGKSIDTAFNVNGEKITTAYQNYRRPDTALGTVFGVHPKDCKYMLEINKDIWVPSIIGRCVQCLMQPRHLSEIGIFRISGSQKLIDDLQEKFDVLGDLDLVKTHVDAHTAADLMKRYLRTLPRGSFGEWPESKARRLLETVDANQLKSIRSEIYHLNRFNRDIIRTVLRLLVCISKQNAENNMSIKNLGIALSPAIGIPSPILQLFIFWEKELYCVG